jgi:hypothetical protein
MTLKCWMGERRPTTVAPKGVENMTRVFNILTGRRALAFLMVTATALVSVGVASASAPVVPAIPVGAYGDSLLSSLATNIGTILPYAAAITAFAIGVGMLKRWLGHRKATSV